MLGLGPGGGLERDDEDRLINRLVADRVGGVAAIHLHRLDGSAIDGVDSNGGGERHRNRGEADAENFTGFILG